MQTAVIYTGRDKFVGQVDEEDARIQFERDEPIVIKDVRVMFESLQPAGGGGVQTLSRSVILLPLDVLNGPAGEVVVKPMAMHFPKGKDLELLNELVQGAEKSETEMRAVRSGIHLASGSGFGRRQ